MKGLMSPKPFLYKKFFVGNDLKTTFIDLWYHSFIISKFKVCEPHVVTLLTLAIFEWYLTNNLSNFRVLVRVTYIKRRVLPWDWWMSSNIHTNHYNYHDWSSCTRWFRVKENGLGFYYCTGSSCERQSLLRARDWHSDSRCNS